MNVETFKKGITYLRHYGNRFVENILLYGGKMIGRIIFPFMLLFGKGGNSESYYPECDLKGKARIFFEQLRYILKYGEMDRYYYRFGFDRKTKNDFKNYVPWLTFTNARNRKNQQPSKPTYDPYNYVCMLRDKFVFEAFCNRVGIKTPVNIGMINDGFFYSINKQRFIPLKSIVQFDMNAFLKRNVGYGGGMGGDVMPMRIEKGKIYINDALIGIDEFINIIGFDTWVVQERIMDQHDALSRFHSSSINTIRIVTIKSDSNIIVSSSFLRIGVNGRSADNISSGGIAVNIIEGKLDKWGVKRFGLEKKMDRHPNSNIVFKNYKIPFWNEILDIVKNAHSLFYGLHSIGWDVCITNDGIKLIEGNDNWDTIDEQFNGKGKENYLKYFKH